MIKSQERENAKRSEQEDARLRVERFEAELLALKSLHREEPEAAAWLELAGALLPYPPSDLGIHINAALRRELLMRALGVEPDAKASLNAAKNADEADLREQVRSYQAELGEHRSGVLLARRVLAQDPSAYLTALNESSGLSELRGRGAGLTWRLHPGPVLECDYRIPEESVVPEESLSLTATGKLSSRVMPRAQATELYQDIVCSGVLRIAREAFATVPVLGLVITAFRDEVGRRMPILSVVLTEYDCQRLNWEKLDPSDAIDRLKSRSDFKASRRSGTFREITPFLSADVPMGQSVLSLDALKARAQQILTPSGTE